MKELFFRKTLASSIFKQLPLTPKLFLKALLLKIKDELSADFSIINIGPSYIFSKIEFSINMLEHCIHVKQFIKF